MTAALGLDRLDVAESGLMPLALLSLDEAEVGILSVLRHIFLTYEEPRQQSWTLAFGIAVERWGNVLGPQIAWAGASFIKALRHAIPREVQLGDPLDLERRAYASGDEAVMMRMLRAMRQDVTPEARGQMVLLTGGRLDAQLVKCGIQLARLLPSYAAGGVMSRPSGPSLRLVH